MTVEARSQGAFDSHWKDVERAGAGDWTPDAADGVRRFFKEHLQPGMSVLEIGCGSGTGLADLVKERRVRGFGIDISAAASRLSVRSAGAKGVDATIATMSALQLGYKDGTFDALYSVGVLEHFRDPAPFLAETGRVIKVGGLMMVDVPQRWNLYTLYKKGLMALNRWPPGWETEFSGPELRGLLSGAGFTHLATMYHGPFLYPHLRHLIRKRARPLISAYDAIGKAVSSPRNQFVTVVGRKRTG
ncbi:MAG: class I SAM-dependent methyltransferase [Euryarchaeota archaeon]|nr:class I SAM-dependent methyltransferase [Euryarchaeota archaeon]